MPTPNLAAQLIAEQYGVRPIAMRDLQNYVFDWRGIFRAEQADGTAWVVRMLDRDGAAAAFAGTAALLGWLEAQGYPAPRVVPARGGALVAQAGSWSLLAITYIAGATAQPTPAQHKAIGAALGRLHALAQPPADSALTLPDSDWTPGIAGQLRGQLEASAARWPAGLRPIYERLYAALDDLDTIAAQPPRVIHGDCWPANAVRTPDGQTVLIDWDGAGYGPPLLDLGKLLLTSHYDLSQPLELVPNRAWVAAILRGYQSARPLSARECALLPAAVPFWLVYSAADFAAETGVLAADDLFFRKLCARLDAADTIAEMVKDEGGKMKDEG